MYADQFTSPEEGLGLIERMFVGGRRMLELLGVTLPPAEQAEWALMRVRNEKQEVALKEQARIARIPGVKRADLEFAQNRLGSIYEDGGYYHIPDMPFREAAVLRTLRDGAQAAGARIVQLDDPVRLERRNGRVVVFSESLALRFQARVTVLAAGVGTWDLLAGLGIGFPATVRQTPLLVVPNVAGLKIPILADRERGFSVALHLTEEPPDQPQKEMLVIGTRVSAKFDYIPGVSRRIEEAHVEKFRTMLPEPLRDWESHGGRFTAGWEVEPREAVSLKHMEPWHDWEPSMEGLYVALPGRATMSWLVATGIFEAVRKKLGAPGPPIAWSPPRADHPLYMHYEPYYNFNDYSP
jgi:hypothetical protein